MLSGLVLTSHNNSRSKTRPKQFNFRIMQPYQGNSQPVLSNSHTMGGVRITTGGIPKTPRGIMQTPGGFPHTPEIYALPSFFCFVFMKNGKTKQLKGVGNPGNGQNHSTEPELHCLPPLPVHPHQRHRLDIRTVPASPSRRSQMHTQHRPFSGSGSLGNPTEHPSQS